MQMALSYGGRGSEGRVKSIREMTELTVDVDRLKKGCFFSENNTVYAELARFIASC